MLDQCFSNCAPRNTMVPRIGVRGSERRKCVMAEEFYWRSSISVYKLKFMWRHLTLNNSATDYTQTNRRCCNP